MMYYDRGFPRPSSLFDALSQGGLLRPMITWIQTSQDNGVNSRLELRKNRGDLRRGAAQVYLGRNAVLTVIAREYDAVSFSCHRELMTHAFRQLPERCALADAPLATILNHLEQCAQRPMKNDEGAVHGGFMCRYGRAAHDGDRVLAIDSEVQLGFAGAGSRTGSDLRDEFEDWLATRYRICGSVPRKLDALGLSPEGTLQVIELKGPGGDLNRAVLQAIVHTDRFKKLLRQGPESAQYIQEMIDQKTHLGLLPSQWAQLNSLDVTPVVAMPDTDDRWFERWMRATRNVRGQVGDRGCGLQLWRLNDQGEIVETRVVETPVRQSWIDFVQAQQISWKVNNLEPKEARQAGHHVTDRGGLSTLSRRTYDRFIPAKYAAVNLLPGIRDAALRRFVEHDIRWWGSVTLADGTAGPTNHLRSSQIHCVNTLMSLHHAGTLLDAVRQLVPDASRLIDLESGHPVAFEWIGEANYLGERGSRRGRYRTSIDAFIVAELSDGSRTGLFLEWKLTETYDPETNLRFSSRGTDRSTIYRPVYERARDVFAEHPEIEAFHFDPHDQLFRQALLADEARRAGEFGVDRMMLVDCVPAQNDALRNAVPDELAHLGSTIDLIWERLLPGPLLTFSVFDPLSWMHLSDELNDRYGALFESAPPLFSFEHDE